MARAESVSIERRYDSFHKIENSSFGFPGGKRAQVIQKSYDELFSFEQSAGKLNNANDDDLELLYRAASSAEFYTFDPRYVRDMMLVLDELQTRGLARDQHHFDMYAALVSSRMLAEAKEFATQHSSLGLEALPKFSEASDLKKDTPTEWVMHTDQHELLRRSVDMEQKAQIIVVSHPLCHFSQNAIRDIESDPLLHEVFKHHAKWIAPQSGRLNLDVIKEWNRQHPDMIMTLAYKRDEWPLFESWGTPTFYFLKEGVLTTTVTGWPDEGRRDELLAAMRQVGLMPSAD